MCKYVSPQVSPWLVPGWPAASHRKCRVAGGDGRGLELGRASSANVGVRNGIVVSEDIGPVQCFGFGLV